MKFHRNDWRKRVFRGELFQQTLERITCLKSLFDSTAHLAQIALRFCPSHPAVTAVIPGVRNPEQITYNLLALEQGPLSHVVIDEITRLWYEEFQYNVRTSIG